MNRYTMICRLRWPAFLLLTGVIALLAQMHLLGWDRAWPLYLILWGVLALAERAAMAGQPPPASYVPTAGYGPAYPPQPGPYAGPYAGPYPGPAVSTNPVQPAPPYQPVATAPAIVPAGSNLEVSPREISSLDPASQPRKSWEEEGR